MSGKILIVDDIATNRIILKVKLSAAYYDVVLAGSGAEAVALMRDERPDLVISSACLPDMDASTLVRSLHGLPDLPDCPILIQVNGPDRDARLAALRAGADDVIEKPIEEKLLLARLRSLIRLRHSDADLRLHASTRRALGFAEGATAFDGPGRVAVIGSTKPAAMALRAALGQVCRHQLGAQDTDEALIAMIGGAAPDVALIHIGAGPTEGALNLVAELRSAPQTRHTPMLIQLDPAHRGLAPTLLDMGADDLILGPGDPQELSLRLSALLRHRRSHDQLRTRLEDGLRAAVIDPLTGLYNRRYALPFLDRMRKSAIRDGRAFGIMVIDLDHFKSVNDRYGHAVGDVVLEQVAQTMQAALRADDMIARIGGEEFLIALPDCTRAALQAQAARMCGLVASTKLDTGAHPGPDSVTISIGATRFDPVQDSAALTPQGLIDQADRALYSAKAGGRNTVSIAARSAA